MKSVFIKKVVALAVTTSLLLTGMSNLSLIKPAAATKADFQVGQGVKWPEQICAPYVDICDYYEVPGYQINGAPYLPKLSEDTGVKFFNLAFIQAAGKTVVDGKVKWGWGGYSVLSESSTDQWQYSGIKQSIKDMREKGGDVTISFGGRDGVAIWQVTRDENILAATYKEIVEGYGLTRVDFDIEEGAQGKQENIQNAKAVKKLQDETGVEVTLTVPVLPSGLTSVQMDVLEAYLTQGVDVKMVNIMAMCYGSGALANGENYGTGSVRAIDSTMKQIKEYCKKFLGKNLTDAEAYRKVGVTTSIGFESASDPIFTPEWSKLVTDHAIEKSIGMTSFWSLNRDSKLQANTGINELYEHVKEYSRFGTTEIIDNYPPEIIGANNKTIKIGTSFNKLSGIKAIDKEDGDITSKVTVTGIINTNVVGDYKLVYSVIDNDGKETKVERIITVTTEEIINNKPVFSGLEDRILVVGGSCDLLSGITATDVEDGDLTHKILVSGSVDTSKVGEYKVTYSVTDSDGATITEICYIDIIRAEDYVEEFDFYKVYNGGEIVMYNGEKYKCLWWSTNENPDSSYAWKKLLSEPVGILDLSKAASMYNVVRGEDKYQRKYDVNSDRIIDIYDLVLIAKTI